MHTNDHGDLIRQMQALEIYDRARRARRRNKVIARAVFVLLWIGIWTAVLHHAAA